MSDKKSNTAFLGVIFPENIQFFLAFLRSLHNQTIDDFDLVILNDGVVDLSKKIAKSTTVPIIEKRVSGTPAAIRKFGIDFLVDRGYENVIFGDTDDCFEANRVEELSLLLELHPFIVNELTIIDRKGHILFEDYLSKRIDDGTVVDLSMIREKNFCGLSNTAIKLDLIKDIRFLSRICGWILVQADRQAYDTRLFSIYRRT